MNDSELVDQANIVMELAKRALKSYFLDVRNLNVVQAALSGESLLSVHFSDGFEATVHCDADQDDEIDEAHSIPIHSLSHWLIRPQDVDSFMTPTIWRLMAIDWLESCTGLLPVERKELTQLAFHVKNYPSAQLEEFHDAFLSKDQLVVQIAADMAHDLKTIDKELQQAAILLLNARLDLVAI
ncbi:hypothetical protein MCEMSHM24_02483 [Comamonadaceae bacterium]